MSILRLPFTVRGHLAVCVEDDPDLKDVLAEVARLYNADPSVVIDARSSGMGVEVEGVMVKFGAPEIASDES
jgi:hypothetical protein